MPTTKDFKLEELSKYFHLPEKAVAKELGICLTSLKKLCRSYGITRWPFRKLKSIQRTLAKVQDESSQPGISAQLSAAGLVLECEGASSNAAGGGGGGGGGGKGEEASKGSSPAQPGQGGQGKGGSEEGGATGRVSVAKKRKPYQLGGRTLLLTEEEKSIYELTLGGGQAGGELKPLYSPHTHTPSAPHTPSAHHASPTPTGGSVLAVAVKHEAPPGGHVLAGHVRAGSASPSSAGGGGLGGGFGCSASGCNLEIRNWSALWTQEHLQKRLLEPLGGKSISITPQTNLAVLHFESEKTATRAELICRAAAAAAEKNMKLNRLSAPGGGSAAGSRLGSRVQSRSHSPANLHQFGASPPCSHGGLTPLPTSPTNLLLVKGDGKGGAQSGGGGSIKLQIPVGGMGGGGPVSSGGGARSGGTSPMFKATPTTPPTSFTSYLFECPSYPDSALGSLMLHPSSSPHFDLHDPSSSCVEVPASSMMGGLGGGPDDMTSALMPGSTMASGGGLSDSVEEEILASSDGVGLEGGGGGAGTGEGGSGRGGEGGSGWWSKGGRQEQGEGPSSSEPASLSESLLLSAPNHPPSASLLGALGGGQAGSGGGSQPPSPLLNPADMAKTPPASSAGP